MNKYKDVKIKQTVCGDKLEMSYEEYITYLTTRPRAKKNLVDATMVAIEKFDKALYTKHKNELNSLFIDRYNLFTVPSFIFIKLGKIASGTFKNMTEGKGISLYDILRYMRVRGNHLTKQSHRIKFKSDVDRLNYELSIMVADYTNFKKESLNKIEFNPKEVGKYKRVKDAIKSKEIKDEIVVNDIIRDLWGD